MYSSQDDLLELIPEISLRELTGGSSDAAIDTSKVAAAIRSADAIIDPFLRTAGYETPMSPVPDIVNRISRDLTAYEVFPVGTNVTEDIKTRKKDALDMLKQIAARKMSLGVDVPGGDASGIFKTNKTGADSVFGKGNLPSGIPS